MQLHWRGCGRTRVHNLRRAVALPAHCCVGARLHIGYVCRLGSLYSLSVTCSRPLSIFGSVLQVTQVTHSVFLSRRTHLLIRACSPTVFLLNPFPSLSIITRNLGINFLSECHKKIPAIWCLFDFIYLSFIPFFPVDDLPKIVFPLPLIVQMWRYQRKSLFVLFFFFCSSCICCCLSYFACLASSKFATSLSFIGHTQWPSKTGILCLCYWVCPYCMVYIWWFIS